MQPLERILVSVDDSSASEKVASYVGRLLSNTENCRVHLFHVVEPLGPYWVSMHGDLTTEPSASATGPETKLIAEAKQLSKPVIERMTRLLTEHGMAAERIESSWFTASREDSLVVEILRLARDGGYGTVVVGRRSLPWYRELFSHHIGERVVKKAEGLSVWVVE